LLVSKLVTTLRGYNRAQLGADLTDVLTYVHAMP
jgi:hypothetical protein